METAKTYVFGDSASQGSTASIVSALSPLLQQRGVDPSVLMAMNNNGFGGNSGWIWLIFLALLWGNNGWGNGFGNNGLANAVNGDAGREMLLNAINGNANAISQLATTLNTNVGNVQSAINTLQLAVSQVGNTVGLSGQQVINAVQSGNASLAQQLCNCCCENRLAVANQTSTLQQGIFGAQTALNDGITQNRFANQIGQSNLQHSLDMASAADNLSVCQQTNTLQNGSTANTQRIVDSINNLHTDMTKEFCDARERDMQQKIDTQAETITQLRGQLSNDAQTAQFYNLLNPLREKVNEIAGKQPNTVPVAYPNLTAVNNTPYTGGYPFGYDYGYGYGSSFWN